MRVVTSGARFVDIDAYAGCIAYAELLNLLGNTALPVSTAVWNESITPTIRSWPTPLVSDYVVTADDTFVLIDVSDPEQFDTFVANDRIAEIIDHHPEFKEYWPQQPGVTAQIELVGAACTLVYERWKDAGMLDQISETSAKLLTAGILDNTLNFRAQISTDRDKQAYNDLLTRAELGEDWPAQYFNECQQTILQDLAGAVRADTKSMVFPSVGHAVSVGQLVVWDAKEALSRLDVIRETLGSLSPEWFINIVSINGGKSYFAASGQSIEQFVTALLGVEFGSSMAEADRLWLRKEIMQADIQKTQAKK